MLRDLFKYLEIDFSCLNRLKMSHEDKIEQYQVEWQSNFFYDLQLLYEYYQRHSYFNP